MNLVTKGTVQTGMKESHIIAMVITFASFHLEKISERRRKLMVELFSSSKSSGSRNKLGGIIGYKSASQGAYNASAGEFTRLVYVQCTCTMGMSVPSLHRESTDSEMCITSSNTTNMKTYIKWHMKYK